jgi:DNA-directed RNA polymerase subunit A'
MKNDKLKNIFQIKIECYFYYYLIMNNNEISNVQFGIASPEYILNLSVVEIKSPDKSGDNSVYDERLGPLSNQNCKTCSQPALKCSGHFGHVNLIEPIPNPFFVDRVISIMNIFCFNCSKFLLAKLPKVQKSESFLSLLCSKSKNLICNFCQTKQQTNYLDRNNLIVVKTSSGEKMVKTKLILEFLNNIDNNDLEKIGIDIKYAHPKNIIMTVLPVISHINRPFLFQGSQICDDDLTSLYLDIVKTNIKVKKYNSEDQEYENCIKKINYSIQILFNNSNGNAKHPSSGRLIRGLVERMTGKDGLFRNNCMGKRSDHTARAVASPGPELTVGQIGIPETIAKILTLPIKCTKLNIDHLQTLCDENKVDRVERQVGDNIFEFGVAKFCNKSQTRLQPGDYLIKSNQQHLKIVTGREQICEGDKIFRKGIIIETFPEKRRKFEIKLGDSVSRFLQNGDVVLVNRQPTLHTGSMTAMDVVIHKNFTFKCPLSLTHRLNLDFDGDETNVHVIQSEEGMNELKENAHSNKTIISPSTGKPFITVVQDTTLALYLMTTEIESVDEDLFDSEEYNRINLVRNGLNIPCVMDTLALISTCFDNNLMINTEEVQIVAGVWIFGKCDKSTTIYITNIVYYQFGHEAVAKMITKWQHVSVKWLSRRGFTIDANDVKPFSKTDINNYVLNMVSNNENGRNIRDELHSHALNYSKNGNIIKCVLSGAKGTPVNIGQIISTVGQQQCRGGLIESNLSHNRVLAQDKIKQRNNYENLIHHGYITSSFASGLSAREYFIHAIPSRDAVVSTATGTANSGYLQHRLMKNLDDIIYSNGQVIYRSGEPKTISLHYNNNTNPCYPKIDKNYLMMQQKLFG